MKKFKHLKTGELATYQDGVLKSSGFCVEIGVEPSSEFWEEVIEKPVLFITTDGKEIREGDNYCYVFNYNIVGTRAFGNNYLKLDNYYFSTRKAAENYIVCNKPCLSFNDVWNISNNKSSDNHYVVIDKRELKKLAEAKVI